MYFKNVDRYGNEILNGGGAPNFNPTPVNYTPAASGNTQNLNEFVIDPNGDMYFIDEDGESFKINTSNPLDVLTTVQPTPTATGNTTNLNTAFKDASGNTWVVDYKGDAILCGSAPFKNLNEWHVDPNGSDTTGDGSQEKPFKTITKALTLAGQGDEVIVHAGVYTENITISTPNVALVGAQSEYGSLTQINGSVSVTASGTSVKIADITMNSLSDTGTGDLYLSNTTVNGALTSSAGYIEIKNSSVQGGSITKSGGSMLIEQSKVNTVNVTGVNTVATIRNSYQDPNTTITYGAGTIYNIQNVQGGDVSLNASAVALETAALAQGLSAEMAKEAETADFMKLGMIRPDAEANPTKIVTWDEVTGRLEVSTVSSLKGDTYKTNSTTCQDIVSTGNITITVATGLAYTPLQDIIVYADANNHMHGEVVSYNSATGVLVMNVHQKTGSGNFCNWVVNLDGFQVAEASVTFGTTAPTSAGVEGDEYFITSDGTSTGTITAQYIYDATSSSWILRPTTVSKLTTTSLTPKVYQGTSFVNAQANTDANVADVLQLSDGSYIHTGKVTWTGHGLTVGAWYYLSQTSAGGYTTVKPTSGWTQQLFFVEDANTIHVDIEEAWNVTGSSSQNFAKNVYVNGTDPNTASIFDLNNPPTTNDDNLKSDVNNLYIGTNGQTWTYNSSTGQYSTYVIPATTKAIFKGRYSTGIVVNPGTGGYVVSLNQLQINTIPTAWNNSTGTFTAPSSGYYMVAASLSGATNLVTGSYLELWIEVNGVIQNGFLEQASAAGNTVHLVASGAVPVYMAAGNTLRFRFNSNLATFTTHVNSTYFSITQL